MAKSSLNEAFAYAAGEDDSFSSRAGRLLWAQLELSGFPPGLDYFILDTALSCGVENTLRWLRLATGGTGEADPDADRTARTHLSSLGVEMGISALELYRRRRYKADPQWHLYGVEWSNRCNRARKRALAMALRATYQLQKEAS